MCNSCSHISFRWVDKSYEDYDGQRVQNIEEVEYSTTEDIDVHRYRCTQCGEVMYYSGAAEAFYVHGKRTGIFSD